MPDSPVPAREPESRHVFTASFRGGVEQSGNGRDQTLVGHGAVFNSWSETLHTPGGSFREQIAEGAFDDVLGRRPDTRLLVDHAGVPLARTKSGTLDLSVDDVGLRTWARIHPSRTDVISALERGDLDQMSFAFTIDEDEWKETDDPDVFERTITRVGELYDVSLVTYPAYPDTDAALREIRSAADAGKIVLHSEDSAAQVDPAGDATNGDTDNAAQDEPVGEQVDPLAALRTNVTDVVQRERESYLRLIKELAR
jgi:HK97 family phage prohead protease